MTIQKRLRVPLTFLKAGESGMLISIGSNQGKMEHGNGQGFIKRLMDMGLTPYTKVMVIKAAPFRGPVEILVRGARLALGRGMAERIIVEILI